MYDLIGDIHGHADELEQLLHVLGYRLSQGVYSHPSRQVIFLGDFIDRGPKIKRVLDIVRPMTETGSAISVMGNHELNALAFHGEVPNNEGSFLRKRNLKNIRQHAQTILQLPDRELTSALEWFLTLPLWIELDGLRVVHACWDTNAVTTVNAACGGSSILSKDVLPAACVKGSDLFTRVAILLKGKEASLPKGVAFADKDGHTRDEIRTRWYLSPSRQTYRTYAFQADTIPCDLPLEECLVSNAEPYPSNAKPVFIGHYWLSNTKPELLATNVACLDYSVAKGGFLCAYRWEGEQDLSNDNFVWVSN